METLTPLLDPFLRLFIAALLGMLLGVERAIAGKTAGMRTYALVAMGAALFIVVSEIMSGHYAGAVGTSLDPLRVASQIVMGIGFIGGGLIIFRDSRVNGLTTAAGLWVAAGIGMAAGFGLFAVAVFATALTIFVFTLLWYLEEKIKALLHARNINSAPASYPDEDHSVL